MTLADTSFGDFVLSTMGDDIYPTTYHQTGCCKAKLGILSCVENKFCSNCKLYVLSLLFRKLVTTL